jgi:hypothetical protein
MNTVRRKGKQKETNGWVYKQMNKGRKERKEEGMNK